MTIRTQLDVPTVVGKRATHEAMTLHPQVGTVVVENASHEVDGEHSYEVTIEDGHAVACTCPDFEYRRARAGEACKHVARVALSEAVVDVADPVVVG